MLRNNNANTEHRKTNDREVLDKSIQDDDCLRMPSFKHRYGRSRPAGGPTKGSPLVTIAETIGYGGEKRRLRRACVCRADAPSIQLPPCANTLCEHTCYRFSTNSFVITLSDTTR